MDTTLHLNKAKTATVKKWFNAAGQEVPAPEGWEWTEADQADDGGNTFCDSNATSMTLRCHSLEKKGDYDPPTPVRVRYMINDGNGGTIEQYCNVGLLEPLSSTPTNAVPPPTDLKPVRVEIEWGPEQD